MTHVSAVVNIGGEVLIAQDHHATDPDAVALDLLDALAALLVRRQSRDLVTRRAELAAAAARLEVEATAYELGGRRQIGWR